MTWAMQHDVLTALDDHPGSTIDVRAPTVPFAEPVPSGFRRTLRVTAVGLCAWCAANVVMPQPANLTTLFFRSDLLWLMAFAAALFGLSAIGERYLVTRRSIAILCRPGWPEAVLVVGCALVSLVGARVVYHGYALSRDEAMAWFDAVVLGSGRLLAALPPPWRPFAEALEPRFMLAVPGHHAWISSYLPVNAGIRALLDVMPGFHVASPVLVGIAICATCGVARQIWPDRRDATVVAGVLLATSSQLLVTSFTPYAMTAHLTLNMVWLWLFLRERTWSHAAAIGIGLMACGLHQLVFHPLFVLPFIAQLWVARRWRLAAAYTLAYAGICLFWVFYWRLLFDHYELQAGGTSEQGIASFANQVLTLVRDFRWSGIALMGKNLTRALAWQNVLVTPLMVVALASFRKLEAPLVAMTAGIGLTIIAMAILLPYQGHGWGYRYVHGLLGSMSLLAAQGWILSIGENSEEARRRWTQLGGACLFSLAVVLPGHALQVEAFVRPYAYAQRAIAAAPSDLVIVDPNGMSFAEDLVRNDPFLRNRPLVLDLWALDADGIRELCATHTVTIFDHTDGAAFNLLLSQPMPPMPTRTLMDQIGCAHRLSSPPRP